MHCAWQSLQLSIYLAHQDIYSSAFTLSLSALRMAKPPALCLMLSRCLSYHQDLQISVSRFLAVYLTRQDIYSSAFTLSLSAFHPPKPTALCLAFSRAFSKCISPIKTCNSLSHAFLLPFLLTHQDLYSSVFTSFRGPLCKSKSLTLCLAIYFLPLHPSKLRAFANVVQRSS